MRGSRQKPHWLESRVHRTKLGIIDIEKMQFFKSDCHCFRRNTKLPMERCKMLSVEVERTETTDSPDAFCHGGSSSRYRMGDSALSTLR